MDFRVAVQLKEKRLQRELQRPLLAQARPYLAAEGDWERAWESLGGAAGRELERGAWAAHSCKPEGSGKDGR